MLPVQRGAAPPRDLPGQLHRPGDRVQQGTHRGRLTGVPGVGVDRIPGTGTIQPDRVEAGELHAEAVIGYRVAAGGDPVQARSQVRGDVADEDHRLAQCAGRRDQPPEPPAPVGRGRIAGVSPG